MNYVEINGEDVDLDDYLDEFGDQTLVKELEYRGYTVGEDTHDGIFIPDFNIVEDKIKFIFKLMNLDSSHGKDRLLKEISDLF